MTTVTISEKPISESKNVWVVRAGKEAEYYAHFRRNGIIAIGHTQGIDIGNIKGELSPEDIQTIASKYAVSLRAKDPDNKALVTRQVGQVNLFATKINKGDTILTITASKVLVGEISSLCYYDETPLIVDTDKKNCEFPLRYNVKWGKAQKRDHIPYTVDKSFRNSGTVFRLSDNDKIKALNHWLSPIHFLENEVRCSIIIQSKLEISNRPLTNLSDVYDKLELLANYLDGVRLDDVTVESFTQYINDHIDEFNYKLTAQHAFMSPGFQFIQLKGSHSKNMVFALALACLFDVNLVFAEKKTNDQQLQEKVVELVNVVKTPKIKESIKSVKAAMQKQMVYDDNNEFETPVPSDDTML